MEINRIYQRDCLEFMASLPDESVDMIVTSPPYNFGGFSRNGRERHYDTYSDNMPIEDYKNWIGKVLSECSRILHTGGQFIGITRGCFGSIPISRLSL